MPVIIRETRIIAGEQVEHVKVYKMGNPTMVLTREFREQADQLDEFIRIKMEQIKNEINEMGWQDLRGRRGVLRLWYEVGKRLDFIDQTTMILPEDKKWVWRAIFDHAGELVPKTPKGQASPRQKNVHFKNCHFIGQFSWDFVQRAGTWGTWWDLFYSAVIRDDPRILDWIGLLQRKTMPFPRYWLRKLAKVIRQEFKNIDTSVYSDEDLRSKLDGIYKKLFG